MGSSTPKTQTQTSTTKLSPEASQIAALALPGLNSYANSTLTLPAPNIAGFNPNEVAGQNAALAAAGTQGAQVNQAANTNSFLMNTALQDPSANPWLSAAADTIYTKNNQNLLENVLPALRSGSVVSGGLYGGGNTRQGIAQGEAVGRSNQTTQDAVTNLYNDAWKTGLATTGAAVDRSGTVSKNLLDPAITQSGVGAQQRSLEQAQNDAAAQYSWLQQQLPFLKSQQLYQLISGMPGGTGVTTNTGVAPAGGGIGGGVGGALSGASLGSTFGPIGTGLGAIGGGLAGFFAGR